MAKSKEKPDLVDPVENETVTTEDFADMFNTSEVAVDPDAPMWEQVDVMNVSDDTTLTTYSNISGLVMVVRRTSNSRGQTFSVTLGS